jgi:hypothetical protein
MLHNLIRPLAPAIAAILLSLPAGATELVYTGNFQVSASVDVLDAIPSGGQVWCHFRVSAPVSSVTLFEDGNVQATLSFGTTYSCRMTMYFIWDFGNFTTAPPPEIGVEQVNAYLINTSTTNAALVSSNLTILRNSEHINTEQSQTVVNGSVAFPTVQIRL